MSWSTWAVSPSRCQIRHVHYVSPVPDATCFRIRYPPGLVTPQHHSST